MLAPRIYLAYLSKRWLYKTAMEGGGSTQQRVFRQKNSTLNSVHGGTLFNSATKIGDSDE